MADKPRNGWHTSNRQKRTPEYWRNRAITLREAGHRCEVKLPGFCTGAATQTDHVLPVWQGGTDERANLRAACAECNAELNLLNRPKPKPKTLRRPREAHPGLIA